MENVGGEHATGDAVATAPDAEGAAVAVVDGGALLAAVGVDVVLKTFGLDAYIVREMMIAATFDQVEDVAFAQQVLKPFRLTGI
jgi:hypothetical protein